MFLFPFLAEDAAFLKEALASVSVDQVDRMKVRCRHALNLSLLQWRAHLAPDRYRKHVTPWRVRS
jgi:hypothetical protein